MTSPQDVVGRLIEVPLSEIEPGTLASAAAYRAAGLIPLLAFAARDADLRGVELFDPGVASVIDEGRSAIVAGIWENRRTLPRIIEAFEGFQFAEYGGWLESLPTVSTALGFDLGVREDKRREFWLAVDRTFSETRARLLDVGELRNVLSVDIFRIGGVESGWAVLSLFNWTRFAGETANIVGGLTVAAAGISSSAILLVPAGVLLICAACLKQMAE